MCGIAAVVGLDPAGREAALRRILLRIEHRGESSLGDEIGTVGHIGLGARRLAVQSELGARQPIRSSNGRVLLAYNGEVYNWRDLMRCARSSSELVARCGDGQVVADLLAAHGTQALAMLDGMFACVWYDSLTQRLHWARDRMGIKPLYRALARGVLYLCSELKGLAPEGQIEKIDEVAPAEVGTAECGFDCLGVDGPRLKAESFWHLEDIPTRPGPLDPNELLFALEDAVLRCLDCPQEVGVYLSGGLDSAGVLALAQRVCPERRVVPLTLAANDESAPQDATFASALCEKFEVTPRMQRVPNEEELFAAIESTIQICESFEPNVVRQSSVQRWISELGAREGLKVVLCGEGADELFCGYPEMVSAYADVFELRRRFIRDLHRTQLQRVDRVAMSMRTEVRVPFLSNQIVSLAMSCNAVDSFIDPRQQMRGTKVALRQALGSVLSEPWVSRPKVVLSEGVGLGSNDPDRGLFAKLVSRQIRPEMHQLAAEYAEWGIKSDEEALYFWYFKKHKYDKYSGARDRVTANRRASVAHCQERRTGM